METRILTLAVLVLALALGSIYAEETASNDKNILLINSNASVERYKVVQEEFSSTVSQDITAIDLAGQSGSRSHIEQIQNMDIVYCIGAKSYQFAYRYRKDKPIVFSSIINWRRIPMSENTFGVSNELHTRMPILIYRSIFPGIKNIGVLYSREFTMQWFLEAEANARELDINLVGQVVSDKRHVGKALEELLEKVHALWLIPDPTVMSDKRSFFDIMEKCDQLKIPVFSYRDAFAFFGATLTVSADEPTIGRQAAGIVMDLISGRELTEKVQSPAGSRITLNLKKVNAYNLDYKPESLGLVNEIMK